MRLPVKGENLVGKICVCSVGRPGIVTGRKEYDWGTAWCGLGLDGKGNWSSTNPAIIAESGQDFHDLLSTRFNGKMSFNS